MVARTSCATWLDLPERHAEPHRHGQTRLDGGIAIGLLSATPDRISKAWVVRQPEHIERGTPWWERHKLRLIGIATFLGLIVLAQGVSLLDQIDRRQALSMGSPLDDVTLRA